MNEVKTLEETIRACDRWDGSTKGKWINRAGILPDWMIRSCVRIEPLAEGEKRPGIISYGLTSYGYDARLGTEFKLFSNTKHPSIVVDVKAISEKSFERVGVTTDESGSWVLIPPNGYILGETLETFDIPRDILCVCVGKSSYARAGLIVNVTPLEPEWKGKVTIEISNASPLPAKVYANEGVMQILFFRGLSDCEKSYLDKQGVYQNQTGLTLPRVRT